MEKEEYKVRHASKADLLGIMWLIRQVVFEMNKNGMYHWNLYYPNEDIIKSDIEKGCLYLIKNHGVCVGIMTLNQDQVAEYDEIKWSVKSEDSLVIHRMGVHPEHLDEGIGKALLDFAEKITLEKDLKSIRLDSFTGNAQSMNLCSTNGYAPKGELFFEFQKTGYTCFEKTI
ncbi:GNAT family N-acetyltransferase [Bacteroidales bacterium]|nr:GNAT family N-acetyltransferase [Bacteroidales bacterium]